MLPNVPGVLAILLLGVVAMSCGANSTQIKMTEQKPLAKTEATQEPSKVDTKGSSNRGPESVLSKNSVQTSPSDSGSTSTTPTTTSGSTPVPPSAVVPIANEPQPDARWESEIKPLVKERCSRCHSYFAEYKFVIGQKLEIIPRLAPTVPAGFKIMPEQGSPEDLAMTPAEKLTLSQYLEGKK
jgi:hypothetical protein